VQNREDATELTSSGVSDDPYPLSGLLVELVKCVSGFVDAVLSRSCVPPDGRHLDSPIGSS
jgi:hypothetical protein